MFNELFTCKETIQRYENDVMLPERLKYLKYCSENGTAKLTLRVIARYLSLIVNHLDLKNKKIISLQKIHSAARKWARHTNRKFKIKEAVIKHKTSLFIWHAVQWLQILKRLKHPIQQSTPLSSEIAQYLAYMQHEKGCSEISVKRRKNHLEIFAAYLAKKTLSLQKITIFKIDGFFTTRINANKYSRYTLHGYACAIKAFISYAEEQDWCSKGIGDGIKIPRLYKDENIPYSPSWSDVKKLIANTEGNDLKNIRDRAILLLLAVYGLRCSEVITLKIDDIDWNKELIYLRRSKNSKTQQFPLSPVVGKAILRYIKEARPNNHFIKEIFLTTRAPHKSPSSTTLSTMVHRRWMPLNIKIKRYGTHSLRHACATNLLNKGFSLTEISNHLGHNNLESTRIYAKVDLTSLRMVAKFNIRDVL